MRVRQALMLSVLTLTTTSAFAQGILIVQKETRGSQSETNLTQIDKNFMRVESKQGTDQAAFVFDGPGQAMRLINISKKSYTEITKADLAQMSGMMAQMQQQLAALPPEQRRQVEQMMQGRGIPGAAAVAKVEYRQAGTDKVGQWNCTKYEGFSGREKTSEVCTVDPKVLNVTAADLEIAKQLGEFMKTMVPDNAMPMLENGTVADQGFSGFPIRRAAFSNGTVQSVSEITEVRRATFPASTFEVPAGFRKEAMPGMRGR
jgi:hypothetical protein